MSFIHLKLFFDGYICGLYGGRGVGAAEVADQAVGTVGFAGFADVAAMEDKPVVGFG